MMKLKIREVGKGNHPREVMVAVQTTNGDEQMVVHERSIHNGALEIGYPISEEANRYLIELPRETVRGAWRVWVPAETVS